MLGVTLYALASAPSCIPIQDSDALAMRRMEFPFSRASSQTTRRIVDDRYIYHVDTMQGSIVLFPAGEWRRRYLFKVDSLSLTEIRNGRPRNIWAVDICRLPANRPAATGTLNVYLARLGLTVDTKELTPSIAASLAANKGFAAYSYSPGSAAMLGWFVTPDGQKSMNLDQVEGRFAVDGIGKSDTPFPISDEERQWMQRRGQRR